MITKDELLKRIGELLDELKAQHELLTKGDEREGKLETELFEANASYFASHVSILNKLISSDQETADTGKTAAEQETGVAGVAADEGLPEVNPEPVEETIFTPATVVPAEKPEKEDKGDEDSGQRDGEDQTEQEEQSAGRDTVEAAQDEPAGEQDEVESDNEDDRGEEPDKAESVEAHQDEEGVEEAVADEEDPVVQEVQIEKKEVTIPDEPPSRPLTLNERLSAQRTQQAGSYYQAPSAPLQQPPQRVSDLKTAISLNDKLLFIRDLFNGYSLAYSEAIELLNRFDNFADAQAFLEKNYAEKNNWASKQQAAEKLYGILRKKFI